MDRIRVERLTRTVADRADHDATVVPPERNRVCWSTVAGLGAIHVGGAAGVVHTIARPVIPTLLLAAVLYALCGLSITTGYHRLFAHRTFRAPAPARWVFLAFGAASFQNSALSWSADHRAHHADTDGPGDPHAVTKGELRAGRLALLSPCSIGRCDSTRRSPVDLDGARPERSPDRPR